MNRIYRLVWSATQRAWIVTGELTRAHKKTTTACAVLVLSSATVTGVAATGSVNVYPYAITNSVTGTNGLAGSSYTIVNDIMAGAAGTNGAAGIEFFPTDTSPTQNNQVTVNSGATVKGGDSGKGYNLEKSLSDYTGPRQGGIAGNAGDGMVGDNLTLTNNGTIQGGNGAAGGSVVSYSYAQGGLGGNGGNAINGNNLNITNTSTISGGTGGIGGYTYGVYAVASNSGNGGLGIKGNNITLTNTISGFITGGNGQAGNNAIDSTSGNTGNAGNGGDGGDAIQGDNITISNSGAIQGGNGAQGGRNDIPGTSGNGGDAIQGSDLTVTNSGIITKGTEGGVSGNNTVIHGTDGAALRLTGGTNILMLNAGSAITGDIVLEEMPDANHTNMLSINSNALTTITGNLTAKANSNVSLFGQQVTFTDNATFADNTTLTFNDKSSLKANSVNFTNTTLKTNITNWNQNTFVLVATTAGISGTYRVVPNALLSEGSKDYATVAISGTDLIYSLKWNTPDSSSYGTFDLKEGSTLNISTSLANNTNALAASGWDGTSLTKSGMGTLILSGNNTYTGSTAINSGTLKLATTEAISGTSAVMVGNGATLNLGGNSQTLSSTTNNGTIIINDDGATPLENAVTVAGDMINNGLLIINNCTTCAGQSYIQQGNWTGNGGTVSLGTVLGDDNSLTDQLKITGSATGTTYVQVINEGGSGAQTLEGIKLITTGSSTPNAFVQRGRIVTGSYEYHLQQGTASGANSNNWYLSSHSGNTQTYRPERGSYASNLLAAGTMFNTRLSDRQGSGWYTDPVTGKRSPGSLWARAVGGHTEGQTSDGQSHYQANRMVFQIGGDILTGNLTGDDAWHLGIMAGYGKQYSSSQNQLSGYHSKGEVSGYSSGFYGTWYQNAQDKAGLYIDSWMLYNWFDNSVKGDELAYEKYRSKGFTASVATGYAYHIGSEITANGMENNFWVTPQAQILWSGVRADDHTEQNGTRVQGIGSDNLQTRLGMRVSMIGQNHLDKGTVRKFEPFIEANWLYTAKEYGVRMGDDTAYIQGTRNAAEIKTGLEGRVSESLSVWGNIAQQLGTQSYRDTQGMLGLKYVF